jgi:hypothetical protein
MPGITNEHDLTPLFDSGPAENAAAGREGALAAPRSQRSVRGRLVVARRVLDGIGGLGWSVIGFLVGAVFWHFVGFWGFMANVVLAGGSAAPASSVHPLHVERWGWTRVAEAAVVAPLACTALILDRQTGLTSARACDGEEPVLPTEAAGGRQDRLLPSAAEPAMPYDPAHRSLP